MSAPSPDIRVLVVADNASARFGGEAILPLHIFRGLRQRGVEAWMIVHERTRQELTELLGADIGRVHFVPDTALHRGLHRLSQHMSIGALRNFTVNQLSRLWTQYLSKQLAKHLIRRYGIDLVHQPTPVSPKEFSLLYGLGVPVVIGPMNGNMTYPPAFARMQNRWSRLFVALGRGLSDWPNRLLPGKLRASTLLVANDRTAAVLPRGVQGRVVKLVENGVHPGMWGDDSRQYAVGSRQGDPDALPTAYCLPPTPAVRFAFVGRFELWKGIDLLLEAFEPVMRQTGATLEIIGDGPPRQQYEALAQRLGLGDHVTFRGFLPQERVAARLRQSDVFVLPSLFECGGAVVLEAMAAGVPVIAARWGGPADYLDDSCGVLVDPVDRPRFIARLSAAMIDLARDAGKRRSLACAARKRALEEFDWDRKIERVLELYAETIRRYRETRPGTRDSTR